MMADAMDFLEALDDEMIGGEIGSYIALAKVLNEYVDGRIREAVGRLRVEYVNSMGSTNTARVTLADPNPKKAEEPQPAPAPEALKWSQEPPTEPGMYWTRPSKDYGSMSLASVAAHEQGLKFRLPYGDVWYKLDEGREPGKLREWVGPVCRSIVDGDAPPALSQPFTASAWSSEAPDEVGLYYMRYGPHGKPVLVYVDYDRLFRHATPGQAAVGWMGCVTETERGAQWLGPLPVPPPPGMGEPVRAEEKREGPVKEEAPPSPADYVGDPRYLVVDLQTKRVVTTLPGSEPTPAPVWTRSKPTEPGVYWLAVDNNVGTVRVRDDGTYLNVNNTGFAYKVDEGDRIRWAGPVPYPEPVKAQV